MPGWITVYDLAGDCDDQDPAVWRGCPQATALLQVEERQRDRANPGLPHEAGDGIDENRGATHGIAHPERQTPEISPPRVRGPAVHRYLQTSAFC